MSLSIPGAVFEHYGPVPSSLYCVESFQNPLEEAVYQNDTKLFHNLVQEGHTVSVKLKIGKMSCLEYCAMMGYDKMLKLLIDYSTNSDMLKKYFALEDVVERAYLISKHKDVFFKQDGLAEANRYEAALYTAVEYNQPQCVAVMLTILGTKEPAPQSFYIHKEDGGKGNGAKLDKFSALQLAQIRGHKECLEILARRRFVSE